jgi:hypothetical protein
LKDYVNGDFFYDYDLTEVIDSTAKNPELTSSAIIGQVVNSALPSNTPFFPVPIPSDDTNLNYPPIQGNPIPVPSP